MSPLALRVEGCKIDAEQPGAIRLDDCRPAPVNPAQKEAARALLPTEGIVKIFGKRDREKLVAIRRVLAVQRREDVYDIMVVDIAQAWVGLYERAILIISLPALKILNDDELTALVAHETGHEYVWAAFESAHARRDAPQLRRLELACDAVAGIVLAKVGISPDRLDSALRRTFLYNRDRFGIAPNQGNYPSLKERRDVTLRAAGAAAAR